MINAVIVEHAVGISPDLVETPIVRLGFLGSDAAAFISGCDIRVDGGLVGAGKHLMGVG